MSPGGAFASTALVLWVLVSVVLFFTTWTPPPYGWSSCDEPGAPPACACASDCV